MPFEAMNVILQSTGGTSKQEVVCEKDSAKGDQEGFECGGKELMDGQVATQRVNDKFDFHKTLMNEVAKLDDAIKSQEKNIPIQKQIILEDIDETEIGISSAFLNFNDQSFRS